VGVEIGSGVADGVGVGGSVAVAVGRGVSVGIGVLVGAVVAVGEGGDVGVSVAAVVAAVVGAGTMIPSGVAGPGAPPHPFIVAASSASSTAIAILRECDLCCIFTYSGYFC